MNFQCIARISRQASVLSHPFATGKFLKG